MNTFPKPEAIKHKVWLARGVLLLALVALLLLAIGCALKDAARQGADVVLEHADKNKDGKVTLTEANETANDAVDWLPFPDWLKALLALGGTAAIIGLREWRSRKREGVLIGAVRATVSTNATARSGVKQELLKSKIGTKLLKKIDK